MPKLVDAMIVNRVRLPEILIFLPVRGGAVSVIGGLVSVIIIFGFSPSEAVSLFIK